jgi:16S rRNA (uracil1498-N3)-methyltransferase
MHRFYLPDAASHSGTLVLHASEAHHALHVLRIRPGERVTVLDGKGREYSCEVQKSSRQSLELSLLETKHHAPPPCRITLLQAVPKGKLIETIIQKATELGAARVVPLLTERVILHVDDKEGHKKAEKWQAVAIEAIKQCGAPYLPEIAGPTRISSFLARKEPIELPLVGSLEPGSKHPREHFETFRAERNRNPASACVWIGPEGDFTSDEYRLIASSGAFPITLGRLVLRTDTAACYCLSVLNYELNAWP